MRRYDLSFTGSGSPSPFRHPRWVQFSLFDFPPLLLRFYPLCLSTLGLDAAITLTGISRNVILLKHMSAWLIGWSTARINNSAMRVVDSLPLTFREGSSLCLSTTFHVLVGINERKERKKREKEKNKKNHIWVPAKEREGAEHAGRLIASIVIDLATKSSAKFKYTHEIRPSDVLGLPFRCTVYFRAVLTDGTCSYRSGTALP